MLAPPESARTSIDLMSPSVVVPSSSASSYTPSVDLDASGHTNSRVEEADVVAPEIAQKETRAVQLQRVVVFFVLLVCCALAAVFTYIFTSQGQENDFRTEFNSYASEMIEVTKHNSETIFDVISQFSVTTTSFALYDNATWPAVTLPDFEARSTAFRQVTRAQFLAVLPKVDGTLESLDSWGAYSVANQGWIQESQAYIELHGAHGDAHGEEQEDGHAAVEGHDEHAEGDDHNELDDHDEHAEGEEEVHEEHMGDAEQEAHTETETEDNDEHMGNQTHAGVETEGHVGNETGVHHTEETSHLRRLRALEDHVETQEGEHTMEEEDHTEDGEPIEEDHRTEAGEHDTDILDVHSDEENDGHGSMPTEIPDHVYRFVNEEAVPETGTSGPIAPLWQAGPVPPNIGLVNFNMLSIPLIAKVFKAVLETRLPVLSQVLDLTEVFSKAGSQAFVEHLHGEEAGEVPHPESLVLQPIFKDFGVDPEITGALLVALPWNVFFDNLLNGEASVFCVVTNKCGQAFTYLIEGQHSVFLGSGDLHDPEFDDYERSTDFTEFDNGIVPVEHAEAEHDGHRRAQETEHEEEIHIEEHAGDSHAQEIHSEHAEESYAEETDTDHDKDELSTDSVLHAGRCDYTLHIYPTQELKSNYDSNKPAIYTVSVVLIFVFTSMVFILYDCLVERRQRKVMSSAKKTGAIVSSLFPSNVHDRLFDEGTEKNGKKPTTLESRQSKLEGMMMDTNATSEDDDDEVVLKTKPIADLFPATTIMFADLVGFTNWSSSRDPCDVFTLLETLFRAFDKIAKRRRVFKVETIGDCYVAVCGLPVPRRDHALVMARFSRDIKQKMEELIRKLELTLGPGTGDLLLRVGLHSGPVTAGVLRGEKSRFQLFGDTMNTASRMESTGERDRIQMSQETAHLLMAAGKSSWVSPRKDKVVAKGKGALSTYWLVLKAEQSCTGSSSNESSNMDTSEYFNDVAAAAESDSRQRPPPQDQNTCSRIDEATVTDVVWC